MSDQTAERLIEVWKLLECLRVSLDKIATHSHFHGAAAAQKALDEHMSPAMYRRIADAWSVVGEILEQRDPSMAERLETIAENDEGVGYWRPPKESADS